jgi:hypothetical protein
VIQVCIAPFRQTDGNHLPFSFFFLDMLIFDVFNKLFCHLIMAKIMSDFNRFVCLICSILWLYSSKSLLRSASINGIHNSGIGSFERFNVSFNQVWCVKFQWFFVCCCFVASSVVSVKMLDSSSFLGGSGSCAKSRQIKLEVAISPIGLGKFNQKKLSVTGRVQVSSI